MSVYLMIKLTNETSEALTRIASQSLGQTPEALGAEAIETFVKAREEARRRLAESPFLFDRRNRAR